MKLAKYKACICEGAAESAIIDILVDHNLLIFSREEMLDERVIRCRNAKKFEQRYLRKGFDDQISVIRILDSRREDFRLSKAYQHKIDIINVITALSVTTQIYYASVPVLAKVSGQILVQSSTNALKRTILFKL